MKQALIFLHLPKAGGSTLRALLYQQYASENVYKIESDINGDILRIAELDAAQIAQTKLLVGHMSFGLHQYFEDAKYLTLLREPIKRVVSEYRFLASNPHHVLYESVSQMSLLEYLQCGLSGQISNGQTRLIAGIWKDGQCGVPGVREVTEADYQQALLNLDSHFISPGVLDYYDQSLLIWQQAFGWRWPFYRWQNVTPGQSKPLSEAEIAAITALNEWDLKLYAEVKTRQEAELAAQPASFTAKVKLFRSMNAGRTKLSGLRARLGC